MCLAGSLQHDEIHIWQVKLDDTAWDAFSSVLSGDEREKAERYRTPALQKHYRRCRSALRLVLGLYTQQAAAAQIFRYGQFGKPELPDRCLHFNLSHSGDHALIAISAHPVGIDLECTRKTHIDPAGLIDLLCHPEEKIALALLPETEKFMAIYQLWTQKEAYCKMLGIGLQQSLDALRFGATAIPSVFRVYADGHDPSPAVFVHNLKLPDGYAASVCLPLADARIGFFNADASAYAAPDMCHEQR